TWSVPFQRLNRNSAAASSAPGAVLARVLRRHARGREDWALRGWSVDVSPRLTRGRYRSRKNPCMPWGYPEAVAPSLPRTHAVNSTILAIDLGKFNSVMCWSEPGSRAETFRTVATTPDNLRRELLRRPVARVVFEACSQAGWVHDLCEELKLPALVASTT